MNAQNEENLAIRGLYNLPFSSNLSSINNSNIIINRFDFDRNISVDRNQSQNFSSLLNELNTDLHTSILNSNEFGLNLSSHLLSKKEKKILRKKRIKKSKR